MTPVMVVQFRPPAAVPHPLLKWATRQGYAVPTSGTLSWRPPQGSVVARMVLAPTGRVIITSDDQEILLDNVVGDLAADAPDQSWQQAAGHAQRVLLYLGIGALPITTKGQLRQAAATHCLLGGWSHVALPDR
ncbi:MAG: hypothetical protein M3Y49_09795 [Actinomycetota bacterium]|nr:hypothetical protein [Actinomycetota bacterium]